MQYRLIRNVLKEIANFRLPLNTECGKLQQLVVLAIRSPGVRIKLYLKGLYSLLLR